jgi:hypothetical protein
VGLTPTQDRHLFTAHQGGDPYAFMVSEVREGKKQTECRLSGDREPCCATL